MIWGNYEKSRAREGRGAKPSHPPAEDNSHFFRRAAWRIFLSSVICYSHAVGWKCTRRISLPSKYICCSARRVKRNKLRQQTELRASACTSLALCSRRRQIAIALSRSRSRSRSAGGRLSCLLFSPAPRARCFRQPHARWQHSAASAPLDSHAPLANSHTILTSFCVSALANSERISCKLLFVMNHSGSLDPIAILIYIQLTRFSFRE